jgi:hypothetical protein
VLYCLRASFSWLAGKLAQLGRSVEFFVNMLNVL